MSGAGWLLCTLLLTATSCSCVCREGPNLPSAPQAMAFVEALVDAALALAEEDMKTWASVEEDGTALSAKAVQDVRDAALLALIVGHVGMAFRIANVRTIKAAQFADLECRREDCTLRGCLGNRLEWVGQAAADLDPAQQEQHPSVLPSYRLVIAHHKTAHRGIRHPPVNIHSAKLTKLLALWEDHGRPQVGIDVTSALCFQSDKYVRTRLVLLVGRTLLYKYGWVCICILREGREQGCCCHA